MTLMEVRDQKPSLPNASGATLFRYAFLGLPLAFAGLPIYMLAPDFYVVHQGLSLAAVGFSLLALRLVDAGLDPLLGRFIDTRPKLAPLFGLIMVTIMCLAFCALFLPPKFGAMGSMLWFVAAVFFVTTAFSGLTILYGSVGASWTRDLIAQTRITTSREGATLLGLILSVSLPFIFLEVMSARSAYLLVVIVFVCLVALAYWLYRPVERQVIHAKGFDIREAALASGSEAQPSKASASSEGGAKESSLYFLYFVYLLSAFASAVPAVLVIFFVRDYLGSEQLIGLALIVYFLSGALSMPFWNWLAKRVGKIRAWQFSMGLAVASFGWVCLLSPGDFVAYVAICFFSGAALGAEMALPPSILADRLNGRSDKSTALKYSGLTMIGKLNLALATGACLYVLGVFGFEPNTQNHANSLDVLVLLYGAVPCFLKLLALVTAQIWIQVERGSYASFQNNPSDRSVRNV